MKILKVGIIGYGSIGKKHYYFLKKLNKNIDIVFIRVKNKIKIKKNINQLRLINAVDVAFDCVFICTPANTHLEIAKFFIKNNIPTFIEKPLIDDYKKIKNYKNLINYIYKNKVIVNVGYVLKHNNSYKKFKQILSNNKLGKIIDVKSNCNSNLLTWRGSIAKSKVSTNKELGGGVINELSHEIDYLNDLFGKIESVYANINKKKLFKINSEESVDAILINKNKIPINLHLDFNSSLSDRYCEVRFEKGNIKWDVKKNTITIFNNTGKIEKFTIKSDHYMNQIKYFLNTIKTKKFHKKYLNDAIEVTKIIYLIKKSDQKRLEFNNK